MHVRQALVPAHPPPCTRTATLLGTSGTNCEGALLPSSMTGLHLLCCAPDACMTLLVTLVTTRLQKEDGPGTACEGVELQGPVRGGRPASSAQRRAPPQVAPALHQPAHQALLPLCHDLEAAAAAGEGVHAAAEWETGNWQGPQELVASLAAVLAVLAPQGDEHRGGAQWRAAAAPTCPAGACSRQRAFPGRDMMWKFIQKWSQGVRCTICSFSCEETTSPLFSLETSA